VHTPSITQQIARLNALTEMGLLFDTVCRAWATAPGAEGANLIHANGAIRSKIRRMQNDGTFDHTRVSRPMRNRRPLDPLSYSLETKKDTGVVVWTGGDDAPPALPGGFPVITPEDVAHVQVRNHCRAVMPLSWGHDVSKSVEPGQSSSSAGAHEPMNLLDANALVIIVPINPDRIMEWAEWMCEHGFVLKHVCGERMTRVLRHPHRDFWYDPEFSPSALSVVERQYLRLWWDTKLPETKLADILEMDPKTIAKIRGGLAEKYGDHLHRLACRMGYAADNTRDATPSGNSRSALLPTESATNGAIDDALKIEFQKSGTVPSS
jgi:hypothetical protein